MNVSSHRTSASELLAQGLVSRPDAVAEIRETLGDPHSGPGGRAYRVTVAGGLSLEVLPERGLDLGAIWFAGHPMAWRSALGPRGSIDPSGAGWIGTFTGGILATCGFDNIGPARDGFDLHGSHHATPADGVAVRRSGSGDVVITGTIESSAVFGRRVETQRTITVHTGEPRVSVRDVTTNHGTTTAQSPVLYHLNFGAPFLMPGTEVTTMAEDSVPRDEASAAAQWHTFPTPTDEVIEYVWEHKRLAGDDRGMTRAVVQSSGLPVVATVEWRPEELQRCIQWTYPTRGGWALGIEPTNAPLFGPDRERPRAGAPVLEPGQSQTTGFSLLFRRTDLPTAAS